MYMVVHFAIRLVKYEIDDTVIVGLLDIRNLESHTNVYFNQIRKFHQWCIGNYLYLNVKKTKEIVIDYLV